MNLCLANLEHVVMEVRSLLRAVVGSADVLWSGEQARYPSWSCYCCGGHAGFDRSQLPCPLVSVSVPSRNVIITALTVSLP